MKSSIWIPLACFAAGTALASVGFFLFSTPASPERTASVRSAEPSASAPLRSPLADTSSSAPLESATTSASSAVSAPAVAAVRRSSVFSSPTGSGAAPSGGIAYSDTDLSSRSSARTGAAALPPIGSASGTTSSVSASSGNQATTTGGGASLGQTPASAAGFAQQVYTSGNTSSGGVTLPLSLTPNLESAPAVTDQQLAAVDDAANQFLEQVQNSPAPTSSDRAQATWDRAAAANDDLLRAKLGWAGFNAVSRQSAMPATDSAVQ